MVYLVSSLLTNCRGSSGVLSETPLKTPLKTLLKTPEKIWAAMRLQADITTQELAHLLEKSESAANHYAFGSFSRTFH
jgi:hypothetical protein